MRGLHEHHAMPTVVRCSEPTSQPRTQRSLAFVVDVHGRAMVCLAKCVTIEELRDEVADA